MQAEAGGVECGLGGGGPVCECGGAGFSHIGVNVHLPGVNLLFLLLFLLCWGFSASSEAPASLISLSPADLLYFVLFYLL